MERESIRKQFESKFIIIDYQYSLVLLQKSFRSLEKIVQSWVLRSKLRCLQRWREKTVQIPRISGRKALTRLHLVRLVLKGMTGIIHNKFTIRLDYSFKLMVRKFNISKTTKSIHEAEQAIYRINQTEIIEINTSINEHLTTQNELEDELNSLQTEGKKQAEKLDRLKSMEISIKEEEKIREKVKKINNENEILNKEYKIMEQDVNRFIDEMGSLLEGKQPATAVSKTQPKQRFFTITL